MTGKEDEPGWVDVLEVVEVELGSASQNQTGLTRTTGRGREPVQADGPSHTEQGCVPSTSPRGGIHGRPSDGLQPRGSGLAEQRCSHQLLSRARAMR
jgi:hypothetical protein